MSIDSTSGIHHFADFADFADFDKIFYSFLLENCITGIPGKFHLEFVGKSADCTRDIEWLILAQQWLKEALIDNPDKVPPLIATYFKNSKETPKETPEETPEETLLQVRHIVEIQVFHRAIKYLHCLIEAYEPNDLTNYITQVKEAFNDLIDPSRLKDRDQADWRMIQYSNVNLLDNAITYLEHLSKTHDSELPQGCVPRLRKILYDLAESKSEPKTGPRQRPKKL